MLKGQKFSSKEILIQKVQEIWKSFPQDKINSLVLSFENGLKWVTSEKVKSISNILRKGIHQIPPFDGIDPNLKLLTYDDIIATYDPSIDDTPIEFLSKRPFTLEENILLLSLVKEFPNKKKWKLIEPRFENRTAATLRAHYYNLMKLH